MRKITIDKYELEFDEALVTKLELLTCEKFEILASEYVEMGFDEETMEEILAAHSKEEIQQKIQESVLAELRLYE